MVHLCRRDIRGVQCAGDRRKCSSHVLLQAAAGSTVMRDSHSINGDVICCVHLSCMVNVRPTDRTRRFFFSVCVFFCGSLQVCLMVYDINFSVFMLFIRVSYEKTFCAGGLPGPDGPVVYTTTIVLLFCSSPLPPLGFLTTRFTLCNYTWCAVLFCRKAY